MKCLYCSSELNNIVWGSGIGEIYECSCGLKYTKELVNQADPIEWERVRRWRLFSVVKGESGKPEILLMHTIWTGKESKTVHPLHYKIHQFLLKKGWIKWA